MGNFAEIRPSISNPSHFILTAYCICQHWRFIQYGELLLRSNYFYKNPARFLNFRACIYRGRFIWVLPWPVRILYRNMLLNLGTRENCYEQSVNFSEKQRHFLKNLGCIVKGIDDVTITRSCISSPTQIFSAVIPNEAVNILVLTYGSIFHKTAAQTAQ